MPRKFIRSISDRRADLLSEILSTRMVISGNESRNSLERVKSDRVDKKKRYENGKKFHEEI
ncbi:MAG: hypothetical protein LIP04_10430 [Tannerellaceae bacterium]|nr:hypothetical protein [Tannerellaceae bacterium]